MLRTRFIALVFLTVYCPACAAQTNSTDPRLFEKAGFAADFPCEPKEREGVFQKEPKLARSFSYECSADGIKYSVSLPERFDEFEPSKASEQLQEIEQFLKQSIGPEGEVRSRDVQFGDYKARELLVIGKNRVGKMINIAHPRGTYGVQAYSEKPSSIDMFDARTKKFFDSFKLVPEK